MVDCFIEKEGISILLVALDKFEIKSRQTGNHNTILMILKLFEILVSIEKSLSFIYGYSIQPACRKPIVFQDDVYDVPSHRSRNDMSCYLDVGWF